MRKINLLPKRECRTQAQMYVLVVCIIAMIGIIIGFIATGAADPVPTKVISINGNVALVDGDYGRQTVLNPFPDLKVGDTVRVNYSRDVGASIIKIVKE